MEKCILSLDQSSQITGYASFINGNLQEYGVIDLHKNKDTAQRFLKMQEKITDLISRFNPDCVVLEDIVLQYSPCTLRILAQLQGAIMSFCFREGIAVKTIYPTVWRKNLGMQQGRGLKRNVLKTQAINFILKHYGIDAAADEADAICIGLAYMKQIGALNE